jgi:hypothetical protein
MQAGQAGFIPLNSPTEDYMEEYSFKTVAHCYCKVFLLLNKVEHS